jgi:uncharacterized protein YdhG (YjbR/CyaY superfamily)
MKRVASGASTVDGYLARVTPDQRAALVKLRRTIRAAAPRATESISYGIPTFKQDARPLVYFSAAKEHLTLHAIDKELLEEAKRRGFGTGQGSIRFTPEKSLPDALVTRVVKARLARLEAGAKSYGRRAKRR